MKLHEAWKLKDELEKGIPVNAPHPYGVYEDEKGDHHVEHLPTKKLIK